MGSYQGYSEHYHQQPQFYQQYDSSPIPKPAGHSDLEAVRHQNYPPNATPNEKEQRRKICGLGVVTFWIVVAIFIVILAGGIGGGIGGGLAASSSSKNSSGNGSPTTVTVTASGTGAFPAASTVPSTGFAQLYCKNHTIYITPNGDRFKQFCAIDWASGDDALGGGTVTDLQINMASTYQSCMNQCSDRNKNSPDLPKCKAIAYDADLTQAITENHNAGNCWFKSAPGIADTLVDDPYPERMAVAQLLD